MRTDALYTVCLVQNGSDITGASTIVELIGMYPHAATAVVGYQILEGLLDPLPVNTSLNTSDYIAADDLPVPMQVLVGEQGNTTEV